MAALTGSAADGALALAAPDGEADFLAGRSRSRGGATNGPRLLAGGRGPGLRPRASLGLADGADHTLLDRGAGQPVDQQVGTHSDQEADGGADTGSHAPCECARRTGSQDAGCRASDESSG